ncbi:MAG TPA: polyhydroxyalkanoic acid system family protein [Burkholderiaceae bacterium]
MPDLSLHRDHDLGLPRARKVALKWAEHIEEKLEMECTLIEGDDHDVLEFTRSGVQGRMLVAADRFHIEATLGFLFKPFLRQIETEASRQLDEALAKESKKAAKTAASPKPRKK